MSAGLCAGLLTDPSGAPESSSLDVVLEAFANCVDFIIRGFDERLLALLPRQRVAAPGQQAPEIRPQDATCGALVHAIPRF
jgi:hypothetical protein